MHKMLMQNVKQVKQAANIKDSFLLCFVNVIHYVSSMNVNKPKLHSGIFF